MSSFIFRPSHHKSEGGWYKLSSWATYYGNSNWWRSLLLKYLKEIRIINGYLKSVCHSSYSRQTLKYSTDRYRSTNSTCAFPLFWVWRIRTKMLTYVFKSPRDFSIIVSKRFNLAYLTSNSPRTYRHPIPQFSTVHGMYLPQYLSCTGHRLEFILVSDIPFTIVGQPET